MNEVWRVYYMGEWPKKKRQYLSSVSFPSRQKARNWCRNHRHQYEGLTIVGPKAHQVERFR